MDRLDEIKARIRSYDEYYPSDSDLWSGALKHSIEDVKYLLTEIDRLKEGNFTEEEFQNLCHNKNVQSGYDCFVRGCNNYQKKLFGRSQKEEFQAKEMLQKIDSINHQFRLLMELK